MFLEVASKNLVLVWVGVKRPLKNSLHYRNTFNLHSKMAVMEFFCGRTDQSNQIYIAHVSHSEM